MFTMSRSRGHSTTSRSAETRSRRSHRNRPGIEAFESRLALSLGAPFAPPTIPTSGLNGPAIGPAGDQLGSANSTSRSGAYQVIVWADNASGNGNIMGQVHYQKTAGIFTASQYVDFTIDNSSSDDSQPSVAINDNGNFVVTWTRKFSDGSLGVMAREYDDLDQPLGSAFVVDHTVGHAQYDSHVAISPASKADEFVVSYTVEEQPTMMNIGRRDIYAQSFNFNGSTTSFRHEPVWSWVNGGAGAYSSVAMDTSGNVFVAYEVDHGPTSSDIWLVQYNPHSVASPMSTMLDNVPGLAKTPSLALGESGLVNEGTAPPDADVVWAQGGNIWWARVNNGKVGTRSLVTNNGGNTLTNMFPVVAAPYAIGGNLVVAWIAENSTNAANPTYSLEVSEYMLGKFSSPTNVSDALPAPNQGQPTIPDVDPGLGLSIDMNGHFLLSYTVKTKNTGLDVNARYGTL